jgi:hypothetical protein
MAQHSHRYAAAVRDAAENYFQKIITSLSLPRSRPVCRRLSRRVPFDCRLQAANNRFLAETNGDPKPFVWTAHPDRVIAAVQRGTQALASVHFRDRNPR